MSTYVPGEDGNKRAGGGVVSRTGAPNKGQRDKETPEPEAHDDLTRHPNFPD